MVGFSTIIINGKVLDISKNNNIFISFFLDGYEFPVVKVWYLFIKVFPINHIQLLTTLLYLQWIVWNNFPKTTQISVIKWEISVLRVLRSQSNSNSLQQLSQLIQLRLKRFSQVDSWLRNRSGRKHIYNCVKRFAVYILLLYLLLPASTSEWLGFRW